MAVLTLAACDLSPVPSPDETDPEPGAPRAWRVSHVYDGDTIEVATGAGEGLVVRLVGINAPEGGECFHDESLDHMAGLVLGRELRVETAGEDQFGRTLAHVWADDMHANLEMVAAGRAIATTPDGGDPHGTALLEAESSAIEEAAGLWAGDACGPAVDLPRLDIEVTESDPEGPDQDDLAGEVVRVVNGHGQPVDIGGWVLRDESSRHRYRFPTGTTLPPGAMLEVSSADPGWEPGGGPVWNNDGDMAMLLDADGRVVSAWRY